MGSEEVKNGNPIVGFVKSALDSLGVRHKYMNAPTNRFLMRYKNGEKSLDLTIYVLKENRIYLRIPFPFMVKSNVFALVAMYITEYNQDKAFCTLRLSSKGVISMEYTYLVLNASDCNKDILCKYIDLIVNAAMNVYDRFERICMGTEIVSALDRRFYRHIFRRNLDLLYGKVSKDEESFGVKVLKEQLQNPKEALRDRMNTEVSLYCQYGEENKELKALEDLMWEEIEELLDDIVPGPSVKSYEEFMAQKLKNEGNNISCADEKMCKHSYILPFKDACGDNKGI